MLLILFILIAGLFVLYIALPFFDKSFREKKVSIAQNERENLVYQKEELLGAITDLEYDYTMKKMTEADYLQQKEKLMQETVEIMKKLDALEDPEKHHAADIARKKQDKVKS
jgi:hypothetical protein